MAVDVMVVVSAPSALAASADAREGYRTVADRRRSLGQTAGPQGQRPSGTFRAAPAAGGSSGRRVPVGGYAAICPPVIVYRR
jgi:hypothetical protein